MNIKNFLGVTPINNPLSSVAKVDKALKSEASHDDRDANGQQLFDRERQKEKMSDEQFEKALQVLRDKNFVKDMNWVVEAYFDGDLRYAWVKDQSGASIRKVSEYDLWELFDDPKVDSTKGQLLRKTA